MIFVASESCEVGLQCSRRFFSELEKGHGGIYKVSSALAPVNAYEFDQRISYTAGIQCCGAVV